MNSGKLSRRVFLRNVSVALPVGAVVLETAALAQAAERVELDDPVAQALFYTHDAATLDTSDPRAAAYQSGQTCANCIHAQGGDDEEWRPCNLFSGKLVAAAGWCSGWVAKAE